MKFSTCLVSLIAASSFASALMLDKRQQPDTNLTGQPIATVPGINNSQSGSSPAPIPRYAFSIDYQYQYFGVPYNYSGLTYDPSIITGGTVSGPIANGTVVGGVLNLSQNGSEYRSAVATVYGTMVGQAGVNVTWQYTGPPYATATGTNSTGTRLTGPVNFLVGDGDDSLTPLNQASLFGVANSDASNPVQATIVDFYIML